MDIFKKKGRKNICFIGLMGSGKSIIGKELGKMHKIEFFDTDNEIEEKFGNSINYIFSKHGEKYFRKIEEDVCVEVINKENCIISLGGGSIINSNIRNQIKKNSYCIYLKVDTKTLVKRLSNSKKRPLLDNLNKKEIIEKLYLERKKFYNQANLVIENDKDKSAVIKEISSKLSL